MEKDIVNNNTLDAGIMSDRFLKEPDNTVVQLENEEITVLKLTHSSQIKEDNIHDSYDTKMQESNSNLDQPIKMIKNETEDGNSNLTGMVSEDYKTTVSSDSDTNEANQTIKCNPNDEAPDQDVENKSLSNDIKESNVEEALSDRKKSNHVEESNVNEVTNVDEREESNGNLKEESNVKEVPNSQVETNSQDESNSQKQPDERKESKDSEEFGGNRESNDNGESNESNESKDKGDSKGNDELKGDGESNESNESKDKGDSKRNEELTGDGESNESNESKDKGDSKGNVELKGDGESNESNESKDKGDSKRNEELTGDGESNESNESKDKGDSKGNEELKRDGESNSQVNVSDGDDNMISDLMSTAQIKDETDKTSNNAESVDVMVYDKTENNATKDCGTKIESEQTAQSSNMLTADTENSTMEVLVSVAVERGELKEGYTSCDCLSDDTLEGDTSGDCLSEDTLDDDDVCCTNCQILSTSELETKFQCPLIIAMCTFKNDSILRLEKDGRNISKVNKAGDVTDTVQFDFEACDISLTNDGDILLANYHDECILKYSKDGIFSDFIKIQGRRPMALDVDTNSGELWVACVEEGDNSNYTSSARRYYHDGTLLQIIYFHDNTSSHYPMKISVCSKNGDVAVSETQVDENERMLVTVLNAWGTEKWEYPRDKSFNVEDAAFDCEGYLLATVPHDRGLHLVGEQGTLLSVIYQSCDSIPQIITPSFDGKIWIWCQDNDDEGFQIKVIKYLQIDPA